MTYTVISYRMTRTGVWGYSFYHENDGLGLVNSDIGPVSTVRVQGRSVQWYSQFNIDTNILPGVSRKIKDNRTGREIYRIIYWGPGLYEFAVGARTTSLFVEERKGMYLFGAQGMPVAAMTERISPDEAGELKEGEGEPYFRTTFFDEIPGEGDLMLVLSFPAMRFY